MIVRLIFDTKQPIMGLILNKTGLKYPYALRPRLRPAP
jgi:hypothetical protein